MSFQHYRGLKAACLTVLTLLTLSLCGKRAEALTTSIASSTSASPTAPTPSNTSPIGSTATSGSGVKPQGNSCPANALVKGNISRRRGKIYHLPSSANYNQVKPETCFPNAAAAQKAGYRAPRQQQKKK